MRARRDGQSGGSGGGPPGAVADEAGPAREVPVLYTIRGLLRAAIAEVAGRAVGAVRSRISDASAALERVLLGDGREDVPPADRDDRSTGALPPHRGEGSHGHG